MFQFRRIPQVLKQYKLPVIGPLTDLLSYSSLYIAMLNFLMIAITLYHTTLREYIIGYLPWMNMGLFLLFLFLIVVCIMLSVYKFIVPSYYEFRGRQYQKHGGMAASNDNIARMQETLDSINRRLMSLEKGGESTE